MKPTIGIVWGRIVDHQGAVFRQVRGKEFTYRVYGGAVTPSTTNRMLPRSDFARALELVPLRGPGEIQHLQGPSFIYAILMDSRIRSGDW
ncbi:MAG: hypothetical protein FJ279_04490 [Planctomycetes bacterium]|nr:hypothetical protein [Planctomycetota bacterium]